MHKYSFLFLFLFGLTCSLQAQFITVSGVSVTGRFNTCSGSNTPTVTAQLISSSSGSSVSGGMFICNNRCDSSTIRVTISNAKWNKNPNAEWLHGLFLPANAGFSVAPVSVPAGFIAYNPGCVGMCPSGSGTNGGPGFYFDNTNGQSCCPGINANDGFPCNNYGDVTMGCNAALTLTFDLTFCNNNIISNSYTFVFTGSSDGETGCYNNNDMLSHTITFTIPTVPCAPININPAATTPIRTCSGASVNFTSTLTGTCSGNSIHWWSAATGGTLLGTGSPFTYDPPGSACPAGTTLYASCCSGVSTNCVAREPVTVPGNCNPLVISGANYFNATCSTGGSISNITLSNAQGSSTYTLMPAGTINTTGNFPNLNQGAYTLVVKDGSACTASMAITITQPLPITFTSPVINNVTCNLPSSGQIQLTASGGSGTLNYSINPSAAQPIPGTFTGLSAQAYTITATDATSCSTSTVVTIATSPSPVWSAVNAVDITCNGANNGSIAATASGGTGSLTFTLSPGGISNASGTFVNLSGGSYTIQVADVNGCAVSTTVSITDPPLLNWTGVNSTGITCSYLNNGSLAVQAGGGTSTIQYQLLPSMSINGSGSFSNLAAGTYTIIATDIQACSISTTVTIAAAPPLTLNSTAITPVLCAGGINGSCTVTGNGGSGILTYLLNPGGINNTTGIFSGLLAGNYTIQVTDANACSATTLLGITEPVALNFATVNTVSPLCFGNPVGSITATASGGTGIYTYLLQPLALSNTGGNFNSLPAGAYTLTVTDANACSITTAVTITQAPQLTWTSVAGNPVSCFSGSNGTIQIAASGGTGLLTYSMQPGSMSNTTGNFSGLAANLYSITVTDQSGCSLSTQLSITQPAMLQWTNISQANVACYGNTNGGISINASGGSGSISYTLLPGSVVNTTGTFSNLAAGLYTVVATDGNNCTMQTALTITQPSALSITNVQVTAPGCIPGNNGSITVTAGGGTISYQYSLGGAFQTSNGFTGLPAGNFTITVKDASGCTVSSNVSIASPQSPSLTNLTLTHPLCNGLSTGSLAAQASGGSGALTFVLQPSGTGNSSGVFNALSAGTYTVIVSDVLGCTSASSLTITQPAALAWSGINSAAVLCQGGSNGQITVNANGGTGSINYTLQPGSVSNGTGIFTNLPAVSYVVTASDANACTLSTTLSLTQPTALSWSAVNASPVSCFAGNNGSISATATGGSAGYMYTLQPGGLTNPGGQFNLLQSGVYTITASDAHACTISTTVSITQAPLLQITSIIATSPTCVPGNDATLSISGSGGTGAYTYSIGGANQLSSLFTGLGAGNYTVTLSDANGCTASSVQTIITPNAPVITSSSANPVTCNGGSSGSISVNAGGGSGLLNYTLQPSGLSNTTGMFNNLPAGMYTVTVNDNAGCAISTSLTIAQPAALSLSSPVINPINCQGGQDGSISVTALGGTAPYSYTLWPSGTNNTVGNFINLNAGNYTISISDANGCTYATTVSVTQPPVLTWNAVAINPVSCNGLSNGSIQLSAVGGSGGYNYTLQPGALSNTSGTFGSLPAVVYTIVCSDAHNCSISTTAQVQQPPVLHILSVGNTLPSCIPGNDAQLSVTAGGGSGVYQYSLGGSLQASNVFNGLGSGIYTIIVSDANGCSASSTQAVLAPNAPVITSINTVNAGCSPGNDGSATMLAGGGIPPYQYALNGTAWQSGNVFTSLNASVYTVTVKDSMGCTVSSTLQIGTQAIPVINNLTAGNASCNPGCDGSISIVASGGSSGVYSYSIDNIVFQSASLFNGLCASTYTIIVKDGNGCSVSGVSMVQTSNGPLINSSSLTHPLCHGLTTGGINTTASGGTGSLTWTLQPSGLSNTNGNFNTLAAASYTVVVNDANGCTASLQATITEPAALQFNTPVVSSTLCSGSPTGSMVVSTTGGTSPISFASNPPASLTPPGTFGNLNGNTSYTITASDAHSCSTTLPVFIPQANPVLLDTLSIVPVSCFGAGNGMVFTQGTGGTGTLTYTLQPGSTSNTSGSFSSLSGGSYSVTIADANNCTFSTSIVITEPPALSINSFSSSQISCHDQNNGSITLGASGGSGGITYSLQPGSVSNSTGIFNALSGSTYTVTISDAAGCSLSTTTTITNPAALQWNSVNHTALVCHNDSNASISVNASGGVGGLSYTSLPSGGSNASGNFFGLPAGNYTLTCSDANACAIDTLVSILQPAPLTLLLNNSSNVTCSGGSNGLLNVSAGGGYLPYTYLLSPGSVGNSSGVFTGLTAGVYTIQVIDSNACQLSVSPFIITEAAALIWTTCTHSDIPCHGDSSGSITTSAQGGTGSLTYAISPVAGVQAPAGYFSSLSAGSYTVQVSDAVNCTLSSTVTLNQNPPIIFTRIDLKKPRCFGEDNGAISADANGGLPPLSYSLNGSPASPIANYTALPAGNYLLRVSNALGCSKDTLLVLGQPAAMHVKNPVIDPVTCDGSGNGSMTLTATGGNGKLTYYLSPGFMVNSTGVFNQLEAGVYQLTIRDSLGCQFDTTLFLNQSLDLLDIGITKKDLSCTGSGTEGEAIANVTGGTPPYAITWSTTPPQYTAGISNLTFGYYYVEVVDDKGCDKKDTVYIAPGNCCAQVFIPNVFTPNGDGLNDEFKVTTTAGIDLLQFEVYDRWGNKVWRAKNYRDAWDGTYKHKPENVDTYFYIFWYICTTDGQKYMRKGDLLLMR